MGAGPGSRQVLTSLGLYFSDPQGGTQHPLHRFELRTKGANAQKMLAEAWHSPVLSPWEQVSLLLLFVILGKSQSPSQISSPSSVEWVQQPVVTRKWPDTKGLTRT